MFSSHIIVWNHQLLWILQILLMRLSKESLCCSALGEYLCSSNWLFSGTYEMVSENGTKSYPQCRNRTTSFTVANVYKFHLFCQASINDIGHQCPISSNVYRDLNVSLIVTEVRKIFRKTPLPFICFLSNCCNYLKSPRFMVIFGKWYCSMNPMERLLTQNVATQHAYGHLMLMWDKKCWALWKKTRFIFLWLKLSQKWQAL